MTDQKLEHWITVDLLFEPVRICDIKTPGLEAPVMAFNDNAWNAMHLSTFPFQMVTLGQRLTLAHLAACIKRIGDPCLVGFRTFSPEEYADIYRLSRDILDGKETTDVGARFNMVTVQDYVSFVGDQTLRTYAALMFFPTRFALDSVRDFGQ